MKRWIFAAALVFAFAAYADPPDTSGRCRANRPCDIGGSTVTSVTITTDGTGTAELVLPTGSVTTAEIGDGTLTSSDMAASFTFTSTANDMGWTIQSGANQACTTTCTSACVVGFDEGAADAEALVACADAAADKCLCAGSS